MIEINNEDKSLLKRSSTFAAVTAVIFVMGFGVAVGGFISYDNSVNQRAAGLVFGTSTDQQAALEVNSTPSTANSENTIPYPPILPLNDPPSPVTIPAVKSQPNSTPVVNVCQQALEQFNKAKTSAQESETKSKTATKLVFDEEQKAYSSQLAEYSRQRVGSVNNYLGQIAIATSKYNQSTDPHAYDVYKKEQTDAFTNYSQVITKIGDDESTVLAHKKDSETKYNAAVLVVQSQLTADLAQAGVQYQNKISGIGCPQT